ncbi:enoyl-CoA hydratase/carnithine racemase [Mycolicibacterium sp. BK607]|nr:enoyl-CoA hydratase/carnithine racemase [Mycolicibacterium sp. BK607]
MTLLIEDENRVRTITLNRPEALNAFNEALYDATAEALLAAADDPEVAVVIITGAGRAFSAGQDLGDMQARITDPDFAAGAHGFPGLITALSQFPKPLICAINGVGLGIGATILGYADLAFMSSTARLKCPFTSLGVARGGLVISVAAVDRSAERRVAADVLGVGGRRRGAADGPGLAGE